MIGTGSYAWVVVFVASKQDLLQKSLFAIAADDKLLYSG